MRQDTPEILQIQKLINQLSEAYRILSREEIVDFSLPPNLKTIQEWINSSLDKLRLTRQFDERKKVVIK